MRKMFMCAVAGLILSGSMVLAQEAAQDQATDQSQQIQAQPGAQPMPPGQAEPGGVQQGKLHLTKAGDVIGKEVVDPNGEKLGNIRELAVDGKTGQVAYAVLEFAQIGRDKLFAVPWGALKAKKELGQETAEEQAARDRMRAGKTEGSWFTEEEKGQQFILNVPKDKLAQAPGFDKNKWPDMANPEFGKEVHTFYNQKPYWEGQRGGQAGVRTEGGAGARVDVNRGEANVPPQAEGQRMILKAKDQLIDQNIYNQQGDKIGKLNNLLVDRQNGKIAFVIAKITKGNEGDKDMAALPWNKVNWQWNEEKKEGKVVLNTDVNQLKPQMFTEKDWPDLSNRQVAMNIYRTFNERPYWEERGAQEGVLGFQE
jgi:sporulation protein YlmC with PRC-barrel domain